MEILVKQLDVFEPSPNTYDVIVQYIIYVIDEFKRNVVCEIAYGEVEKYEVLCNYMGFYDIDPENIRYQNFIK